MKAISRPALVVACALYVAGVMGDGGPVVNLSHVPAVAAVATVPAGGVAFSQSDVEVARALTSAPAITAVGYPLAVWLPAAATNYTVADRPNDYPLELIIIHHIESSTPRAVTA